MKPIPLSVYTHILSQDANKSYWSQDANKSYWQRTTGMSHPPTELVETPLTATEISLMSLYEEIGRQAAEQAALLAKGE